jgi:hypothetical protein
MECHNNEVNCDKKVERQMFTLKQMDEGEKMMSGKNGR